MNEDKQTANTRETAQKGSGIKLPYEKPRMTPIALFADQVLNPCTKLGLPLGSCDSDGFGILS